MFNWAEFVFWILLANSGDQKLAENKRHNFREQTLNLLAKHFNNI